MVEGSTEVNAFTEGLIVWHMGRTMEECRKRLQEASDKMVEWSEEWLIRVSSVGKCGFKLFSKVQRDQSMRRLEIRLQGEVVKKDPTLHTLLLVGDFRHRIHLSSAGGEGGK